MNVRTSGCGRVLGTLLIGIGALVILSYYGVIPHRVTRWWPVLVVAFGIYLLLRHYWLALRDRRTPDSLQVLGPSTPTTVPKRRPFTPPLVPVAVMAVGAYLLLSNLHYLSLGVLVAIVLILVGVAFLTGSVRRSLHGNFRVTRRPEK